MTVGRNDPCPCGSGKKYKRCCIDKEVADQKAALYASLEEPVEFVRALEWDDVYKRGGVMFVVTGLRENMHPEIQRALKVRRAANFEGECPGCGALLTVTRDRSEIRHEGDCIASDDALRELIDQHGSPKTPGRRLEDHEVD